METVVFDDFRPFLALVYAQTPRRCVATEAPYSLAVEVQHDHGVLVVHHFDQYRHPGGHIDGTYHMQPPGELEMTVLLHNLERFVDVKVCSHLAFLQPSLLHTLRINSLQRVT